jgi:hypothetical protein
VNLRGEAVQSFGGALDSLDELLQDDLLGGMGHLQLGEVIHVSRGPTGFARVTKAQAQQEAFEPLSGSALIEHGAQAAADQIADRFIRFIGDAHRSQLARAEQPRQLFGIAGVVRLGLWRLTVQR